MPMGEQKALDRDLTFLDLLFVERRLGRTSNSWKFQSFPPSPIHHRLVTVEHP